MNPKAIFEVCAFNIQSAIIAEKAGAVRAELCDNPVEGGTTPSYGAIKQTRQKVSIELYPIIRPRSGNYFYDADEFDMIEQDIKICKELGCDGISIGIQRLDGTIDLARMSQVVEWAYPMGVTCNRVFDTTPDPMQALEDIIAAGCERILTSGQKSAAPLAMEFLATLVQAANDRIIIMPGAGVNSGNIEKLINETGATEFHGSARKIIANPVLSVNPDVLDYGNVYVSDEAEVARIVSLMQ